MSEIIYVNDLKKTFKDNVTVLKGISFSVQKGDVLSIIGPSGSGKSTILRCISQLEEVTDGTIKICGETLVENGVYADKKEKQKITLKSGLVFQNFNLFPHYSVLENVINPQINVLKKSKEEAYEIASDLLKRMGLSEKMSNYPCELSGGQQQRVSIARAVLKNPSILIFDEATAAVDSETEHLIQGAIERLISGRTTLMIAHRLSTLRKANKIVVVDKGEIIECGTPEELLKMKGKYYKLVEIQSMGEQLQKRKAEENFE